MIEKLSISLTLKPTIKQCLATKQQQILINMLYIRL